MLRKDVARAPLFHLELKVFSRSRKGPNEGFRLRLSAGLELDNGEGGLCPVNRLEMRRKDVPSATLFRLELRVFTTR